ncbi:PAQR family membrane homeostasis protein TrhA [Caldisericum exile]|uniref:Hemolysin n=1 Tax=Caldisericum exile (strain DSM 21853 / NBRC 104410 / AZM16c01) TaxID=511051 RepID=A0A7U6JEM5_CALEA|nr:hemolysin III family protein [Caldisericum exile]BAL80628.1 putative hemolysin [Caldisericum exile AZM16c01]
MRIKEKTLYKKEEIGNSITHGVGIALSIAGLVLLIIKGVRSNNLTKFFAFLIFGITLTLLYTASTLYHALYINVKSVKLKRLLRLLDHCAIYLLIAGTYTPFSLIAIGGTLGRNIFILIWMLAIIGIIFKIFFVGRYPVLFTSTYLLMGYLVLFAWKILVSNISKGALILLIAGGLTYTLGVIFYAFQSYRYNHFVWHFFVLGGSILHFSAVLLYL